MAHFLKKHVLEATKTLFDQILNDLVRRRGFDLITMRPKWCGEETCTLSEGQRRADSSKYVYRCCPHI